MSVMTRSNTVAQVPRSLESVSRALAWALALAVAINAYSYSLTTAIPLVQSDVWRFLDGFLGRFLEHGFSVADLFRQENQADTNLPLQKLFLFFHTRFYGMDFRLEGVLGVLSGIGLVAFLARAAAGRVARWGALECWLLALLTLTQLSLNSSNIYTWPLATLWFLPLLIAVGFIAYVGQAKRPGAGMVVAGLLLGVLLDEVAYPVFAAAIVALLAARLPRGRAHAVRVLCFGAVGIALSRLVYAYFNWGVVPLTAAPPRSASAFLSADVWKAVVIPLTDSVVHSANVEPVFGTHAVAAVWAIAGVLVALNLLFWVRVLFARTPRDDGTDDAPLTVLAAGLMLFCYALVAGIVLQRVPAFGFEYLHQPRYVMFYQLQLAALALLGYRELRGASRRSAGALGMAVIGLLLALLQWKLSTLAWQQEKYLSNYLEGAARAFGTLAKDPAAQIECPDIMTVCQFPPAKRAELIGRLQRYRMNVFSPDFQAFHRLHPFPPEPPRQTCPADGPGKEAVDTPAAPPAGG